MNNTKPLEKQDVQRVLSKYRGNTLFQTALQESSSQDISSLITQYVYFNRLFGASVSNLASQLALQTNLFSDNTETSNLWSDRSMEVASSVFAAAIDEFGDRGLPSHPTHRMLAQAVIKGLEGYVGFAVNGIKDRLSYINTTFDPKVCSGYGASANSDESSLFRSLGFHIGSELLADEEFRILDRTLREKYPALVHHLENTAVTISGRSLPAYRWIGIHTTVEIDHFDHALHAANIALQFYSGKQQKEDVKSQILNGIGAFAKFQEGFMKYLSEKK